MIEAALLGAGGRGMFAYGEYARKRPNEIRFVAVAEPDEERRTRFAEQHGIPEERRFETWERLLAHPKLCRALLVCTQDNDHYEPTMRALEQGYDILLEKPMSTDPSEALAIARRAEELGRVLTVCHPMRYSPYFQEAKRIVDGGEIGRVMTVQWTENVGYWHQAHSFVRGNWRNAGQSSPMILQKSCHDMDMLQWLIGTECEAVSSFGSLSYFHEGNAPAGSAARCTDGCAVERTCPFSAIKWYYNEKTDFVQRAASISNKLEDRWEAIRTGPYGRCVYRCDNDVVDHQVVNLRFEGDVTVSFTMTGFTEENARTFKIMGTEGQIRGNEERNELEVKRFGGARRMYYPEQVEGGHNGADTMLMSEFVKQLERGAPASLTSGIVSAKSHLIAFAAEASRRSGRTIDMKEYIESL
ncbi:Gfo/Idh/MocA family oxidoreductase [Paenibacillus antri]|uniref:Gfo/Idh/MocA family oxidoreductase n=1 Tax=Paenibacillus antri TaxID=2582848 RepID=A0A5R9GGI3_9BACL|nr:Gfo/Idh/MocA family oxidoreductase [Paenibacillus antri]TLS52424.1 Gfo/Idh/MocA family oxidoreductase [Paenibacillus antri]